MSTTLRERAEAAERKVQHARDCLFIMAVDETLSAREYAAKYGRFDWQGQGHEGRASGFISGLYFLTGEDQDAIRARVEKAADERQAKQAVSSDA